MQVLASVIRAFGGGWFYLLGVDGSGSIAKASIGRDRVFIADCILLCLMFPISMQLLSLCFSI